MFSYRPELDGLRAIAVLSVLLFHAGFTLFPGGFVGVDIFFVLSGFLITSIILNEIHTNTFSFSTFYERRIRRLVPPLIPVLLLSWLSAFVLFEQQQFTETTKSLYSTLAIASNWYFFSSVGYFDGPGELTPLLHMWSLSIEEQFYLLFPLLLLLTFKLKKSPLALCTTLFILSFCYSGHLIWSAKIDLAFYGSFGRFWELLTGAILACIKFPPPKNQIISDALELAGITLILGAIFFFTPAVIFPGPSALIPIIGTVLVIMASGSGRFISPVLKCKPFIWVGLISYGLYLWHWPILVFVRSVNPMTTPALMSAAILMAFLLATLSYYWLEQPIRRKQAFASKAGIYKFGLTSMVGLALIISSTYISSTIHLKNKLSTSVRLALYDDIKVKTLATLEIEKKHYHATLNLNFHGGIPEFLPEVHAGYTCSFDGGNTQERVLLCLEKQAQQKNILIIGDSIGRDTAHALRRSFPSVNFIMLHHSGCPPVEMLHRSKKITCFPELEETLKSISEKISIGGVILNFSYRQKDWPTIKNSIPLIQKITRNVVMLGVTPALGRSVDQLIKALPNGLSIPVKVYRDDKKMLPLNHLELTAQARELAQLSGVNFADIGAFFCGSKSCRLWLNDSYESPLFWDNQHITDGAMTQYGKFLSTLPEIQAVVRQAEI
nr:acyltransferase family protein [uncultured Pseudomonas sp.]